MTSPVDRDAQDRIIEMALAGTPERVVDVLLAADPALASEWVQVREALSSLAVGLEPSPPDPALWERISATIGRTPEPRRALLVVDMIQDYLTPGGPLEVPRARGIVPALKARLDHAREAQIPVVYVCDVHPPDDSEFDAWPLHALEGTKGCEVWPEIAPRPGDRVVKKRTYSAFHESQLQDVLDELRVDTLILTGCATEVGLLATATDALMRGFRVEVPPDSQAGGNEAGEQVALGVLHVMPPFEPGRRRSFVAAAAQGASET